MLQVAHTADLDAAALEAARALLDAAFDGDFFPDDWEHALGGMHALLWEDGELVAHASVVMRRLVHDGRALRAGYVEGVGVRPDRRRRGHGGAVMEAVERIVRGAYDLGALGATDEAVALYTSCGWRRWEGRLSALTPTGVVRTPDEEGAVYVLGDLDVTGELTCDWRDGDVW
jgi:aminoglycoside 2'-N-acetyltransferase I